MKYALIIPDGCADEAIDALGGRTPLEAASLPNMDAVATAGQSAMTDNTPLAFPAGSEIANLCLLGYDPNVCFTGRAALEAAASGITLGPFDCAVRCNVVTIKDQTMMDFTAGHIATDEAASILQSLNESLLNPSSDVVPPSVAQRLEFVPGVSYRHLLIYRGDERHPSPWTPSTRSTAPHDLTDLHVTDDFPRGPGSDLLVALMSASADVIASHPINQARRSAGKESATHVWLWSTGGAPRLDTFKHRYGIDGVMITAVDLLRGIGALAGLTRVEVEGATGYLDTNYAGKGQAAVDALDEADFVCVHIEAPDEASHEGRPDAKIEALEAIDTHIVGPVWQKLQTFAEHRMLILPDHPTFCRTKKHTHGPVPLIMAGTGISTDAQTQYNEHTAAAACRIYDPGWSMMPEFIGVDSRVSTS
ncbi:MAG: cofactor-independent phosphoglycerate mutase [Planctomycetota bacterium]